MWKRMLGVMKNNNLLCEYSANSATTTIKSLYAVINMRIETDNEHVHTNIYEHILISSSSSPSTIIIIILLDVTLS